MQVQRRDGGGKSTYPRNTGLVITSQHVPPRPAKAPLVGYWSAFLTNRDFYLNSIVRTLLQTGEAFIQRSDIFEVTQRLKDNGVAAGMWYTESVDDGWFLVLH